jgi:PAS domain-containing protein
MDLDVLLGQTADGVCGVNGVGKIALWTQSAERILGYSAREVRNRQEIK